MRQQMLESNANSAKFQPANVEEHRPFGYVVRMKGHDPEYAHMHDMVLMFGPPRGNQDAYNTTRDAFVKRIVSVNART
jgi:hypothetical protein